MDSRPVAAQAADPWSRYQPWRGRIEIVFWIVVFGGSAVANTFVHLMDAERNGLSMAPWQPALWEGSSALLSILLLAPLFRFCTRWPLHVDNWWRRLPLYLLASVVWSILHVVGMVLVRKAGYAWMGESYGPDNWPTMFLYEYLKDVRTFSLIVGIDAGYRWFWLRAQGEARLLARPDHQPAPPEDTATERPERFLVRKLGREFLVSTSDIEWLQAAGNYVNLHVRGRDYPLRSTIAGIEAKLDPGRFARIHRSYIVNLDHVASIEPLDTGDARIHLRDGHMLPVSRRHRGDLRERLGGEG